MASVHLDFVPPNEPGLVALLIEEAIASTGPWSQIEEVTPVGTYPEYISEYTTDDAAGLTNWFRIRWRDNKGAHTEYTQPIQGGTETLPSKIVDRVLLRDSTIKEGVALEEAEGVIEWYFNVDPYVIDASTVKYNVLSGLTYLVMARAYMVELLSSADTESFTAGLVAMKSGSSTRSEKSIKSFVTWANGLLGTNYSVVAVMEPVEIPGLGKIVSADHSRLIVEWQ